jgi:hypothetical protein
LSALGNGSEVVSSIAVSLGEEQASRRSMSKKERFFMNFDLNGLHNNTS